METAPASDARKRLTVSVEVTPRVLTTAAELALRVPPGTSVYIVDMETTVHTNVEIARAAALIRAAGAEPVPHIAARRLLGLATLADRLQRLAGEAGVTDVLVIGGGAREPQGPFASSMDVLATGLLDRHGIRRIGVAGHPEGSPDISPPAIAQALAWKADYARRTGAELRIVTQFSFDAAHLIAWADGLRAGGIDLPIQVGVAGPASIASLVKFAALCGVKASAEFLSRKGSAVASLLTGYDPEGIAGALEDHVATHRTCAIAGLHLYPFGGLKRASEWLHQRGSWVG